MTMQRFSMGRRTVQRFDKDYVDNEIEMSGFVEESDGEVVCPYCGWLEEDVTEMYEANYNFDNRRFMCSHCGKWFHLSCESKVKFYYKTSRLKEDQ